MRARPAFHSIRNQVIAGLILTAILAGVSWALPPVWRVLGAVAAATWSGIIYQVPVPAVLLAALAAGSVAPCCRRAIGPLAMTLLLSAPAARSELAAWDQAGVAQLAKELVQATEALHDAYVERPPPSGSMQNQAYYRLGQWVAMLRVEARELARSLEKGEGREQTAAMYQNLMQLARSARDDAWKTFIAHGVGQRAAAVRAALNQIGPYYDSDFRRLAPHPNIEPDATR